MPRVGILGGAFNPPHLGHLLCAQEARIQLELDRVLLVPVGDAPHRVLEEDPGAEARLELAELAAEGDPGLSVSRLELDRPGPSYTADTLALLREQAPDEELTLILGGDQAANLASWHEPERVLELADVAAVERVDWAREAIVRSLAGLAGAQRLRFVHMPLIAISSSDLRHRAKAGLPLRYLVPDRVAALISERGLYFVTGSEALAERIAAIASDRKATDVRVIDLRGIVSYTDFFVICTGNTERQTKAIHDAIHAELKKEEGLLPRRAEGQREARWILLDYLDCVVHIFTPDARRFYRLEQLWGEAPARSVG